MLHGNNETEISTEANAVINCIKRVNNDSLQINGVLQTNGAHTKTNGATTKCETSDSCKLFSITEIPKYLRFNPYVLSGYRKPNLTFWQCIRSLGYIHNETVNILSHGIPLLFFLVYIPRNIPWNEIAHPLLAYFHILGSVCPWLGSTLYHLFMNHESGEKLYVELLKWDVIGIWVTQSFGASTTVYTSVRLCPHCFRCPFLILYALLSIRALRDSAWASCVWRRRLGFSFLVFMRLIALSCRLVTIDYDEGSETLPIVGAFISASRIPERWWPGTFDYIFNSHNIMHVFVILGGMHMHYATCSDLMWLHQLERNNNP
ncbi:progestin and adipoQ receptor family member 4-like protein [Dinothrombium tinctorium]|uniref:Progestin and adipoQ receptor family member 4-like protein n=1 Tax=Dinothrombium tinctorium TaxID=1965070 RepID=A0A443RI69_9ACAR|nr:progestin and adipoQ receptor family member 4-like protein [Dinothrombium tinctorium]